MINDRTIQPPKTQLVGNYTPMSPFVSGVIRADKIRPYHIGEPIYPYTEK